MLNYGDRDTYREPDYLRSHKNSEACEELRARLAENRLRTFRCGLCGVLAHDIDQHQCRPLVADTRGPR